MQLFGLDRCVSWKNQKAVKRLLASVRETFFFCFREGHSSKLAVLGVLGRQLALLLAGNQALGSSVPMDPALQRCLRGGMLHCGERRHLGAANCSGPHCPAAPPLLAGACWRSGGGLLHH